MPEPATGAVVFHFSFFIFNFQFEVFMKFSFRVFSLWAGVSVLAAVAASAGPSNAPAAKTEAPAAASSASEGESFKVSPPFIAPAAPQSVFVMPRKKEEGLRDPFFPKSNRPFTDGVSPTKVTPTAPVAELFLRGISGTDENPLAIINTTTFGVGDVLDVTTKAGKMSIRCVEINKAAGTALVQVGGERRELHLPTAK